MPEGCQHSVAWVTGSTVTGGPKEFEHGRCGRCNAYAVFYDGSWKVSDPAPYVVQLEADIDQLRCSRDHWKNVTRRSLADLLAIRTNIERFEEGLTVEDYEATISADDVQLIGWCRVLCEVALQDHAREIAEAALAASHPDRASTSPTTRAGEATETKQKERP